MRGEVSKSHRHVFSTPLPLRLQHWYTGLCASLWVSKVHLYNTALPVQAEWGPVVPIYLSFAGEGGHAN